MSDNDQQMLPDGEASPAAEYVLGVLDANARAEIERRLAHEPVLAAEVAFWETRLGVLADAIPPVAPPEAIWRSVESRIAAPVRMGTQQRESLWHSVLFWRGFGLGAAGLAVASLAALAVVTLAPGTQPSLIASSATQGQPGFVATVDPERTTIAFVPAAITVSAQQSPELWLIPAGGTPRSLGVIDPAKPMRVAIPAELARRMASDATLAVSIEPRGGSTTGKPTGPVVASAKLTGL